MGVLIFGLLYIHIFGNSFNTVEFGNRLYHIKYIFVV